MAVTGHGDTGGAVDPAVVDDTELLRLVRAGEDAAFGELFARHAGVVRGYALRCCADPTDADDIAAEAFFRVFQAVRRGSGPADNVRAYLLTVVRRLAAEWSGRKRDVPVADEELDRQLDAAYATPTSRADLQLIAAAFTTLPRRWRAVLWRVEVEGERPAAVGPHFGLSANATAALARRARQGLRAAYLQAHLAPGGGNNGCRAVVAKLGGFTAGQVTGSEADRIRHHLAGCESCAELHAELADVCAGLRRHAGASGSVGGLAGGHHALAGSVGKAALVAGRVAGHVASVGARLKLGVAVVSMVAVGEVGIAAGPLIARLDPSPSVDRGVAVGPALLSTSAQGSTADLVGGPREHRMVGTFARPAGGDTGVRSASRATPHVPPVADRPVGAAAGTTSAELTGEQSSTDGTTGAPQPQRADAPAGSAGSTDGPLHGPSMTSDDPAPFVSPVTTGAPTTTTDPVWSTSWTTDGTTVWVWSWPGR